MTDWVPEPRPAAPELAEDYRAEPFDPSVPFEHDHITSWAKFGDLLGPEGVKRLMRAVQ